MIIEEFVIQYLNKVLDVSVSAEKPSNPPARYVLVEKTGSSRENHIDFATIVLQSYANSKANAAKLNEEVKAAMDNMIIEDDISASKLNTDYDYTDTTKKEYRYQAVYDVVY